jgi:gamma-glutamyltranspeptidase/glutathione hydrolase
MRSKIFKILCITVVMLFITGVSGTAVAQQFNRPSLEDVKVHGTVFSKDYIGSLRPVVTAANGVVAAQSMHAALIGLDILKKGGNAFDAGVAAEAALGVCKMEMAGWCGVSPFIGFVAAEKKVIMRPGVGTAPALATPEWYEAHGYVVMPTGKEGYLSSIMPTNVDTYIAILQDYGTISLAEALEGAIRLAEEGWPASNSFASAVVEDEAGIREWPYNAEVWFQYGRPPKQGELIYQKDLAKTFRLLVEAEQKALKNGLSRRAALEAARDVFYKGEIAQAIGRFYEKIGGLVRYDDVANFRGEWEEPVHTNYKGIDVYVTNTVCQGPMLVEFLNMVENYDVKKLGHNSAEYIHLLSQIINLGMSDRYNWFGDPKFVKIPNGLFTKEYAKELIKKIDPNKAQPEMPPKSNPLPFSTNVSSLDSYRNAVAALPEYTVEPVTLPDTTYLCVMDKEGNMYSSTPSDGHFTDPMIPGYGFGLASRGYRFMRVPGHQQDVAPGKRPMNTTNPALALKNGKAYMAFGNSGGDDQCQTMLQLFLDINEFGMNPQEAVEQNRFGSQNFIATGSPYPYRKGQITIHDGIEKEVIEAVKAKGHKVVLIPWTNYMCNPCMIVRDENGIMWGGADFRRDESYAAGW